MYLFAYGSLMNPRSVAKTLSGERVTQRATLRGYRRKMNAPFDGYAYLNIVPDTASSVSGVLIPMTEAELELFSSREEGYEKVDVTEMLSSRTEGEALAFIAPDIECRFKVPRSYLMTCMSGVPETERAQWLAETIMNDIEEDADNPIYEFAAYDHFGVAGRSWEEIVKL